MSVIFLSTLTIALSLILAECSSLETVTLSFPVVYLFGLEEFDGSYIANLTIDGEVQNSKPYRIPQTLKTVNFTGSEVIDRGFYGMKSLETINFTDNLISIGLAAFTDCAALKSIVIPASVTTIENSVFGACSSLKTIEIKCTLTSIVYGMFSGCSALEEFIIPETVTHIYAYAFANCTSLESVVSHDGVTFIHELAFMNCTNLTTIPTANEK